MIIYWTYCANLLSYQQWIKIIIAPHFCQCVTLSNLRILVITSDIEHLTKWFLNIGHPLCKVPTKIICLFIRFLFFLIYFWKFYESSVHQSLVKSMYYSFFILYYVLIFTLFFMFVKKQKFLIFMNTSSWFYFWFWLIGLLVLFFFISEIFA